MPVAFPVWHTLCAAVGRLMPDALIRVGTADGRLPSLRAGPVPDALLRVGHGGRQIVVPTSGPSLVTCHLSLVPGGCGGQGCGRPTRGGGRRDGEPVPYGRGDTWWLSPLASVRYTCRFAEWRAARSIRRPLFWCVLSFRSPIHSFSAFGDSLLIVPRIELTEIAGTNRNYFLRLR